MHEAFVNINGVPTHVMTWGKWIEENQDPGEKLIICIPGNPGLPNFYMKYLEALYVKLGQKYSIWTMGHAGHDSPPKNSLRDVPNFDDNKNLFDLNGQVEHKLSFIHRYVKPETKVYFIGHSIGAYIILELLKDQKIKSQVLGSCLLFPTIEKMVETVNGIFLMKFVRPILSIILFLSWIFTLFPIFFANFLLWGYCFVQSVPKHNINVIYKLINPQSLNSVFFMAYDEMVKVRNAELSVIEENVDKITFYYSKTDGWAPESYYKSLLQRVPNADAHLCDYDHAFVLRQSNMVADITTNWVLDKEKCH